MFAGEAGTRPQERERPAHFPWAGEASPQAVLRSQATGSRRGLTARCRGRADEAERGEQVKIPRPDVAQSALPLSSSDLSDLHAVLAGPLDREDRDDGAAGRARSGFGRSSSKDDCFTDRTPVRPWTSFENAFWSGQSLEELYRSLSAKPDLSPWARCSLPRCASGSAASRAGRALLCRGPADPYRQGHGPGADARDGEARGSSRLPSPPPARPHPSSACSARS